MATITANIHVRDDDAIKASVGIDRPDIRWVQIGHSCSLHASPAQMAALRDAITAHLDSLAAPVSAQPATGYLHLGKAGAALAAALDAKAAKEAAQ